MTIRIDGRHICIEGIARVEDAEPLVVALHAPLESEVDLSGCEDLHAAVLQVLLIFRPTITGLTENAGLASWLLPLLAPKPSMEANS